MAGQMNSIRIVQNAQTLVKGSMGKHIGFALMLWFCFFGLFAQSQPQKQEKDITAVISDTTLVRSAVLYDNKAVFYVYSGYGTILMPERALLVSKRLEQLGTIKKLDPDQLVIENLGDALLINYSDQPIISISKADSLALGYPREMIANAYLTTIKNEVLPLMSRLSIRETIILIAKSVLFIGIILVVMLFLFKLAGKVFVWLESKSNDIRDRNPQGFMFGKIRYLTANQYEKSVGLILRLIRFLVVILILYNALFMILYVIPGTKQIARQLQSFITDPLISVGNSLINYLPNVFFILVIIFIAKYVIAFLHYLSNEVERGNIQIRGFYADWAEPTFHLCKFLVYFFVAITIFPYLPGSDSPAFRGISLFIGVLFSLGSTSAISNIIAGIILTYMRAFKVGDIIKVGDTVGELIETSLLVIRIKTLKNVEITISNSLVLNGQIIDYSKHSQENNLVLHTKVTIGYDVPWRKVHSLLIDAAKRTKGISESKEPFVLQTALDDYYVEHEINAFTQLPNMMPVIYSELHQNIQDCFQEAQVEIMSPMYNAVRDGNSITIPIEQ